MKIGFIVGQLEPHALELSFDQATGVLRMLMDGASVLQAMPRLAERPVEQYELRIGEGERHQLALQLTNGEDATEPGSQAVPRLSLIISALPPQDAVVPGMVLNGTESMAAASGSAAL